MAEILSFQTNEKIDVYVLFNFFSIRAEDTGSNLSGGVSRSNGPDSEQSQVFIFGCYTFTIRLTCGLVHSLNS